LHTNVIRTSERAWLEELASAYKQRASTSFIDDAGLGVDPANQTLSEMAKRARLSKADLVAVCIACGMSAAGVAMVVLAFLDPEPTTKLGLLVGGGVVCLLGGGFTAIHILTNLKPPSVKIRSDGSAVTFDLSWE